MRVVGGIVAAAAALGALCVPATAVADPPPPAAQKVTRFWIAPETQARSWGNYVSSPQPDPADAPADLTAAGAHPNLNMYIRYCDPDDGVSDRMGCTSDQQGSLKDFTLRLPPGMLGNPRNAEVCQSVFWLIDPNTLCPVNSRVGIAYSDGLNRESPGLRAPLRTVTFLFNVQTVGLEPARLGTGLLSTPPGPYPIKISLRPDDLGIDSVLTDIPDTLGATLATINEQRVTIFGTVGGKPFLTNPTSCQEASTSIEVASREEPSFKATADDSFTPTGCADPGKRPPLDDTSVSVNADTKQTGAPSGYDVKVNVPDQQKHIAAGDYDVSQSQIESTTVTLPDGVALTPGAANELDGCDADEFGVIDYEPTPRFNDDSVTCPTESRIGDVTVKTPLLGPPLTGAAYFATPDQPGRPTEQNPWRLFIKVEGSGVRVKLAGEITVDPDTGQITTSFDGLPQTPFTEFELHTRGGDAAILENPQICGNHVGSALLDGHSGASASPNVTLDTSSFAGCGPKAFQPGLQVSNSNYTAGGQTKSKITIDRAPGQQRLRQVSLSLPAGLVGSLRTIPQCPLAQATAGTCSYDSKLGTVKVSAGDGAGPLELPGSVYLTEKRSPADAAGISVVVPAKVGPIDLGKVVVMNDAHLRPDGGLDVTSDPLPLIFQGIPIALRKVTIDIDRDQFLVNPTGCDSRPLNGTFSSDAAQQATASAAYQATGCDALGYSPNLRLIATGGPAAFKKGGHPGIKAIFTQPASQANTRSSKVTLPSVLRPETLQFNKPGALCSGAQLAARACPPLSLIGSATTTSPLLNKPVSGPVYLVQQKLGDLPQLAVLFEGEVTLEIDATNTLEGVRTVSRFDLLPDVPVSRFELNINGGANGILKNFEDLCENPDRADATFTAHNGVAVSSNPLLELDADCAPIVSGFSFPGKVVRVTRSGVARVRVSCRAGPRCIGSLGIEAVRRGASRKAAKRLPKRIGASTFSVGGDETERINVKLGKAARRLVLSRGRLNGKLVGKIGKTTATKRVTLKAPKRKRSHRR